MLSFIYALELEENDQEYIEQIYLKYQRLLFTTARKYCSQESDCEDVVQDAIVNLCGKVDVLRKIPKYAVPSYIVHTVKHVAINRLRHQAVEEKYAAQLANENSYDSDDNPQAYIELVETRADLSKIWAKLSEQDQELLFRKYVYGQANSELAELYGCREDTIRMRLMRARKKTIRLLKEEAYGRE